MSFDQHGSLLGSLGFTGEQTDRNGLQYLRARYYNPSLGIFLSADPVQGVLGGSPIHWNSYIYAGANPVNYVDPSGRLFWFGMLAAALIGGGIGAGIGMGMGLVFNHNRCFNGCGNTSSLSAGNLLRIVEGAITGAFTAISLIVAITTALSFPIATLVYVGGYLLYNALDSGGASSFSLPGVLLGYDFIQSGFDTLANDPNPVSKLGAVGNIALNIGFGGALYHGLSESVQTVRLALRLGQAGNREQVLREYLARQGVKLLPSTRFYRPLGQRAIEVESELLAQTGWRSAWELAGNTSHELAHVSQEFGRTIFGMSRGTVLRPFQELSDWTTTRASTRLGQVVRRVTDLPLYALNIVEVNAGARGLLGAITLERLALANSVLSIAPGATQEFARRANNLKRMVFG